MSSLNALNVAVLNALHVAGVNQAVIGIDVSANEHLTANFRPHWVLHPRVHIAGEVTPSVERELRKQFPPSDLIPRPLKIAAFDGDLAGIAYGMKPRFGRRQSYRQTKAAAVGTRECRNTRGRPLRGTEAVELAVFLDRVGLRRRLVLLGVALARARNGSVVIRPIRSTREPGPSRSR